MKTFMALGRLENVDACKPAVSRSQNVQSLCVFTALMFHSSRPLPVLPNDRATLAGSPLNLPPGPLTLVHPLTSTFRVHDTEILRTERGLR